MPGDILYCHKELYMKMAKIHVILGLAGIFVMMANAQTETSQATPPGATPNFGMALDLGYSPLYSASTGAVISWQRIGLKPDLALGDLGFGLNLDINYRFNGGANGDTFEIRPEDWVISDERNFLEIYLPKIRYIRLGQKGAPLYLSFGNIENGQLGNGFIIGGYNNTLFQPEQRIFGMSLDLDGALFKFPWLGLETMVGNFAAWDVLGMRLYVRPAANLGVKILEGMQLGLTLAVDTNPYYFAPDYPTKRNSDHVSAGIWGVDIKTPLIATDLFAINFIGDLAMENQHFGTQIGVTGSVLKFLSYTALIRFVGKNFIPAYFDNMYDVSRESRLEAYRSPLTAAGPSSGWLANAGFNFMDGSIYFNASMNGSFNASPGANFVYPDLKAVLGLKPGVIGGLSINAYYNKLGITSLASLVDPSNAIIGAKVNYAIGPAVISLLYDVTYDPYAASKGMSSAWKISSRLETGIDLFGPGGAK